MAELPDGPKTTRSAKRHACVHANRGVGVGHTRGDCAPTRKRCAYCGGEIVTYVGRWGVFVWRGDGHYPEHNALATFTSSARADAWAVANGSHLVGRWIPAAA